MFNQFLVKRLEISKQKEIDISDGLKLNTTDLKIEINQLTKKLATMTETSNKLMTEKELLDKTLFDSENNLEKLKDNFESKSKQ